VALAMLMPTMLLTTACSNEDDVVNNAENTETVANKGYALPVTVNVTRVEGDKGSNRAAFDGSKLAFTAGDKLFVKANYSSLAGPFAGLLDYDAVSGKFSGTIYTESEYTGPAEALLVDASALMATLVPAGYDTYGYLSISNAGAYKATLLVALNKVFALTKKEAVEQLSFESVDEYDNGFALVPRNAVVCFSISGLAADTEVEVIFKEKSDDPVPPVNVTTDASGVATFAVGMPGIENFDNFSLTVDGFAIALPENKNVVAGKIYNMSRPVPGVKWHSSDISSINLNFEEGSREIRGITFACDGNGALYGSFLYSMSGDISFTSSKGNIKKIEINHSGYGSWYGAEGFDGWPSDYDAEGGTFTWEGTPVETVKLPENTGWGQIEGITSIVFTLE
jgi:hypothetical protein